MILMDLKIILNLLEDICLCFSCVNAEWAILTKFGTDVVLLLVVIIDYVLSWLYASPKSYIYFTKPQIIELICLKICSEVAKQAGKNPYCYKLIYYSITKYHKIIKLCSEICENFDHFQRITLYQFGDVCASNTSIYTDPISMKFDI